MPKKYTLSDTNKKAGWKVGTVSEFLGLSKEEEKIIEKHLKEPLYSVELSSCNLQEAFVTIIKLVIEKSPTLYDAAKNLGISYSTLRRKILRYKIIK